MIARLWCQEIISGHKAFKDVPAGLKEQVRELLIESGHEELIIE